MDLTIKLDELFKALIMGRTVGIDGICVELYLKFLDQNCLGTDYANENNWFHEDRNTPRSSNYC